MPTRTDRLLQVPRARVPQRTGILLDDPRFVALRITPDGPGTYTLAATITVAAAAPTRAAPRTRTSRPTTRRRASSRRGSAR